MYKFLISCRVAGNGERIAAHACYSQKLVMSEDRRGRAKRARNFHKREAYRNPNNIDQRDPHIPGSGSAALKVIHSRRPACLPRITFALCNILMDIRFVE